MAYVIPCIRGKMGNTEYYEAKMLVRELVTGVRPAKELDGWDQMSPEEKMQREPYVKRIENELAPYIARTKDRFFGSLIILVYDGDIYFEEIGALGAKMPRAYQSAAKDIGFVTIDGGSLIVLDGQHRLLALEKVFKKEIVGACSDEVPNDEVCVIFIRHESNEKTRRIFNKVNRYAKPTTRGENIITSEDDAAAIVARRLTLEGAPLSITNPVNHEGIVNCKNNTVAIRSLQLTTLSAVYETVISIFTHEGKTYNKDFRPDDDTLDEYYQLAEHYWMLMLEKIAPFKEALSDLTQLPSLRLPESPCSLLFKPAAQVALVDGLAGAVERGSSLDEVLNYVNRIDWRRNSEMWRDIIVRSGGQIDSKADARARTAALITYLIAAHRMSDCEIQQLRVEYNKARGIEDPEQFEPLPTPVCG